MEKGDAILYRIDGASVRIVYLGPAGEIIVDGTYEGAEAARGFVGSFLCRETAFSEKLIRSAWDVPATGSPVPGGAASSRHCDGNRSGV